MQCVKTMYQMSKKVKLSTIPMLHEFYLAKFLSK